jgi:hypothetical protein
MKAVPFSAVMGQILLSSKSKFVHARVALAESGEERFDGSEEEELVISSNALKIVGLRGRGREEIRTFRREEMPFKISGKPTVFEKSLRSCDNVLVPRNNTSKMLHSFNMLSRSEFVKESVYSRCSTSSL